MDLKQPDIFPISYVCNPLKFSQVSHWLSQVTFGSKAWQGLEPKMMNTFLQKGDFCPSSSRQFSGCGLWMAEGTDTCENTLP